MIVLWQDLPPNEVFDDTEGNRFIIPFDIGVRLTSSTYQPDDLTKISALNIFLDYLGIPPSAGVQYEIEGLNEKLSPSQLAATLVTPNPPIFTDPQRPGVNTRVLFSFDKDLLPTRVGEPEVEESEEIDLGETTITIPKSISVLYNSDEIDSLIKDAQNNIRYFQVRAENFKGTIDGISFDEDIKKLSLIVPRIKKFLSENSIEFDSSESQALEFEFNEDYKLQNFLITLQDGITKEPKIGFNALSSEDPFYSYRIMFYFVFLRDIASVENKKLTLMDFIKTYVRPSPEAKLGEISAIDQVKELQRLQEEEGDKCYPDPFTKEYFSGFVNGFTKDYALLARAHGEAIANKFESTEFHPVLGKDTQAILQKITTAADLYEEWWRQADGKEIALRILQCLGVEAISLDFCFTEPRVLEPNILGFNEDLPVIDWTGDFVIELENSLTTFLADTMLAVAQGLLNQINLREVCATAVNEIFGEDEEEPPEIDLTISGMIGITRAGFRAEKTLSKSVRDFFEIEDEKDLSKVDPEKYDTLRRELISIIDDLFLILTTEEICRLFRGESSQKDIFYITNFVSKKYFRSPALFIFSSPTAIRDTFLELGNQINLDFCEFQITDDPQRSKLYDLCALRSDIVDDCLSPEQLDAEVEKLRKAKCEQIERLRDIIENGFAPDGIPPALCSVDEDGNKVPGLVNEPATTSFVVNNAIDASFENVYNSFSSEAEGWKENFITIEDSTSQVKVLITDTSGPFKDVERVNPEVQSLIAQGQPEEQFYDLVTNSNGQVVKQKKGAPNFNKADVPRKKKVVTPSLFQALNAANSKVSLLESPLENEESVYFQLEIPPSAESESLNNLIAQVAGLQDAKGSPTTLFSQVTKTLVNACSKENEGRITPETIAQIIDDIESVDEITKVFNAATLINRPDLFQLNNVRYSLRFAQEKISKNIQNFTGYKKSNYVSLIANLKDDNDTDVEYEIVRFYADDVDDETREFLDSIPAPLEADLKSLNEPEKTYESLSFAKYCNSIWSENGFGQNVGFFGGNANTELFANQYYYDVLGFVNSYFLEKIIDSRFFNIQNFERIELNPARTQREIECKIQNNLLIIENIKEEIVDDFNKNKCDTRDLIINGKPNPNKLNPFDLALIKQQLLTLIRLYIIDYCLRGIFPISVFKKDGSFVEDRLFISFIYEMMTEELNSFDSDFYTRFQQLSLLIYLENNSNEPPQVSDVDFEEFEINQENKIAILEGVLRDSPQGSEENIREIVNGQETSDEELLEQSLQIQNAIKSLIKEQVSGVYEDILLALNSAGIPELKEQFLMSLPETFVATDVNNDTFRYFDNLIKNIKDEGDIEAFRNIIQIIVDKKIEERDALPNDQLSATRKFELAEEINSLGRLTRERSPNALSEGLRRELEDAGLFTLVESEIQKLPLASNFFVEKYCVVEDYTREELVQKIQEAKNAPPTPEMQLAFNIAKTDAINDVRRELENVDSSKLAVSLKKQGAQNVLFVTQRALPNLGGVEQLLINNNIYDEVRVFTSNFKLFQSFFDFLKSNTDFRNLGSKPSEDGFIRNPTLEINFVPQFYRLIGAQQPSQSEISEIKQTVDEGYELYRRWRDLGLQLLGGEVDPNRTVDQVVNLILDRTEFSSGDVVSPEVLYTFLDDNDFQTYPISSIFKSLKYGARLIFIPDDNFDYDNSLIQTTEASENIQKKKLFNLIQKTELNGNIIESAKHPLSVAEYEIDARNIKFVSDRDEPKVFDLLTQQLLLVGTDGPLFYEKYKRELLKGLKQTSSYKFLFDYAFPLYDLSSFYTIYSSIAASKQQGVPIAWDGTKASLIVLMTMTDNRGRFDHVSNEPLLNDPAEFSKALEKAFDILQSCGPLLPCNVFGLGLGGLSSFGFAMKFALRTPKLIFKGLTELIDPNISIASKIKCIGGTELPIELVSLSLLPAPLIPPPFGIGPPLTPLGIAYLLLFGSAFDLGTEFEFEAGNPFGGDEEIDEAKIVRDQTDKCLE